MADVDRSSSDNIANATSLAFVVRNIKNEVHSSRGKITEFHLSDFEFDDFIFISLITNHYLASK